MDSAQCMHSFAFCFEISKYGKEKTGNEVQLALHTSNHSKLIVKEYQIEQIF